MLKNFTIKIYSFIIIGFIALTGVVFFGSSALVTYKVFNAEEKWNTYYTNSANRVLALNALNENIGYGGMIQYFKTYMLRKESKYIALFQGSIGSANAALNQYERSGITEQELALLTEVRTIVRQYSQKFNIAAAFVKMSKAATEIDAIAKVDDPVAVNAIAKLQEISWALSHTDGATTRLELLAQMRQTMGFGGAIHNFKDYLIRQENKYATATETSLVKMTEYIDKYKQFNLTEVELKSIDTVEKTVAKYVDKLARAHNLVAENTLPESAEGQLLVDDEAALMAFNNLAIEIASINSQDVLQLNSNLAEAKLYAALIIVIAVVSSIMLIGIIGFIMLRKIIFPLNRLRQSMKSLSEDQLDVEVFGADRNDEIGLMSQTVQVFKDNALKIKKFEAEKVVQDILHKTDQEVANLKQLASTMISVNDSSQNLKMLDELSGKVSANGQLIATAAQELVSGIDEISTNSEGASADAQETDRTVTQGQATVLIVDKAIEEISQTVENSVSSLDELTKASDEISQIIGVIEGISEQTNLLALNATIEAARAGEAGKGFAVVASEVKSLAQQTSKATEDISQRISALQSGMANISQTLDTSRQAVEGGRTSITETSETMEQAVTQVSNVMNRMQEITNILSAQKIASEEIAKNINSVADMAGQSKEEVLNVSHSIIKSNENILNSAHEWFTGENVQSICEMSKLDHIIFKKKVMDCVMGIGDMDEHNYKSFNHKRFIKWQESNDDKQLTKLADFATLKTLQNSIEDAAGTAIRAYKNNDDKAIREGLEALQTHGQSLIETLNELSVTIEQQAA
ncbi:MAG: HAMP domain-containing protein [Rhizobiales bacterium]|nr:methyl-accepting chemotaxis protein [Hyphomicrobiales bacterium]NRB14425.1 HAMP domain-containing protein [Hyphomicrobiales bacterium]